MPDFSYLDGRNISTIIRGSAPGCESLQWRRASAETPSHVGSQMLQRLLGKSDTSSATGCAEGQRPAAPKENGLLLDQNAVFLFGRTCCAQHRGIFISKQFFLMFSKAVEQWRALDLAVVVEKFFQVVARLSVTAVRSSCHVFCSLTCLLLGVDTRCRQDMQVA